MTKKTLTIYCKDSDCGISTGFIEFEVHDHQVTLPEAIAMEVVAGMPNYFGFAEWDDEVKNSTEYSVPEGYQMADSDYAIPQKERDAFISEVGKNTAQIESGEAELAEALPPRVS